MLPLLFCALFSTAEARPRVVVVAPRPRVGVRVGPVVLHAGPPAPRPGYVWVPPRWAGPRYVPGHWRPIAPPPAPGYVWVDGHWEGDTYMDGYWRIGRIDGMIWVDGEYEETGEYEEGTWVDERTGAPVPTGSLPADSDQPLAIPIDEAPGAREPADDQPAEEGGDLHHAPPDRW